jgi:hypothetical protein
MLTDLKERMPCLTNKTRTIALHGFIMNGILPLLNTQVALSQHGLRLQ